MEKNEMGGAWSMYGERRGSHRVLVGKPERRRLLGRPRHTSENNIFRKWNGGLDWTDLIQNRDR
jgi:hypothetical protein